MIPLLIRYNFQNKSVCISPSGWVFTDKNYFIIFTFKREIKPLERDPLTENYIMGRY